MRAKVSGKHNTIYGIFFVIFVELYSILTAFVFAPALASVAESWIWISALSVFLLAAHFLSCYLLRHQNPVIWLIGIPVNVIAICCIANINDPYFIRALGLYGIFSRFSNEKDLLLTYFPYYIDAILYSLLIVAGRVAFAAPTYYLVRINSISNSDKV